MKITAIRFINQSTCITQGLLGGHCFDQSRKPGGPWQMIITLTLPSLRLSLRNSNQLCLANLRLITSKRSCFPCDPSNHTALGELRRFQISEHVGRRELSCEAGSLNSIGGTFLCVRGEKSRYAKKLASGHPWLGVLCCNRGLCI